MRIILAVNVRGPNTEIDIKPEFSGHDSVRSRNFCLAVCETVQAMLIGCQYDPDAHGRLKVVVHGRTNMVDKIINSTKRTACDQALACLEFIMEKLPHVITKKDKQEIKERAEATIQRLLM